MFYVSRMYMYNGNLLFDNMSWKTTKIVSSRRGETYCYFNFVTTFDCCMVILYYTILRNWLGFLNKLYYSDNMHMELSIINYKKKLESVFLNSLEGGVAYGVMHYFYIEYFPGEYINYKSRKGAFQIGINV